MPPRRTRQSLPTPANSMKAESVGSTPGSASFGKEIHPKGLQTPRSLSDDNEVMDIDRLEKKGEEEEEEEEEVQETVELPDADAVGDAKSRGGRKRKAPGTASSPFQSSPPSSIPSTSSDSKRYTLEVAIPRRTSKLSTEKTTSADNLTLASPVARRSSALGRSSSLVKPDEDKPGEDMTDEDDLLLKAVKTESKIKAPRASAAKGKGKGKSKVDGQPFNISTHSNVEKEDAKSLALDAPMPKRGRVSAARARVKQEAEVADEADKAENVYIEAEDEDRQDDDFAMDSEEEEAQLQRALKASRGGESSSARSSRGSTASARGKAKPARGKGNTTALRTAVAKAAEKRKRGTGSGIATPSSQTSLQPPTRDLTPTSLSESGPELAEFDAESALSALTSDDESEFQDSDDSLLAPKKAKGKARAGAGAKGKGKANGKGKGKGKGKGQKLDGESVEDEYNDDEDMSEEEDVALGKLMKGKPLSDQGLERRRRQNILKQKLGRKLTNGERNLIALGLNHPELEDVWGDLAATVEPVKPTPMEAHPSLKLTLLPFQKESLYWMKKQEEGPWKGGMLADEMGMGKTIQTIALLLSEPRSKPSLVVAPVVALMQWKHEIENNAEGFTVCLWHGQGRMKANDLKKFDVVMVSYGTLEASFRRQQRGFKRGNLMIKEKSPMHEFEWYRVILDEAHNIKERSTNAAKAAFALQAKYKWCLSGTPLQNRVGELYSLVRFLGADPFSHYFCKVCDCKSLHWQFSNRRTCDSCGHKPMDHVCFWNTEILTPIARYGIEQGGPGHTAFKKLKILLDRMMLRRTKLERADDLGLPPRTIVVRRDFFSPAEKELYMSLFTNAKRTFATYVGQGTVLNNYSNIFSLITRMRQMACHPDLVLRSKTSVLSQSTGTAEVTVCRLCQDAAEDAIISQCKHVFDRECIRQYLEVQQQRGHKPECPVCHIEISIDLEGEAMELGEGNGRKARQGILSRLDLDNWRSSSKLEALVEELEKLRNKDCTIKSLVFSQFVSFLDLIAFRLQKAGFTICRLEGGMTPQQRDATIQHFMNNTSVTVFLISLKAGGVALNLTEASMVFMMDSWWNPSVEYQAMDRIHRLGQKRPVTVVKLIVEDSIEDQIVQLQHKKLAMTEAALSKDPDAALGKLTVEDLGFLFKM